ncbi:hypothetical protein [Pararhizobium antarcticum]|uniref:Uncharacterized protein n=1 Tax=Pararhizobium antarcticum TaxID=1798805 RepID=A0A657LUL2_9HYPH|nr:hypothetical protein [Pararhizobium antarcticum]OJF97615.1 hypothetical protein AX760_16780 [Pararhizobium antarcticum]
MNRLMLIAIQSWKAWRATRRLARALPAVAERKQKIATLRSRHRSTKTVIAEQREDIHAALGLQRTRHD